MEDRHVQSDTTTAARKNSLTLMLQNEHYSACLSDRLCIKKESHLLCMAGTAKIDLKKHIAFLFCSPVDLVCRGGCVASPVWYFAAHLSLKSSRLVRSKSSGPTGELALAPHPDTHGAFSFFFFSSRIPLLLLLVVLPSLCSTPKTCNTGQ